MPGQRSQRPALEQLPTTELRRPPLPSGISGVQVRRSARRHRTVSARLESDQIVVLLPEHLSAREEQQWVDRMVNRLGARRSQPAGSDAELARRALEIATRHLDEAAGRQLRPSSVRWVTTMNKRWASCSTDTGAIRVSDRLQRMPDWVLDYVLAHELVHLVEPGHGTEFRALLAAYPLADRAEGYLQGWSAARGSTEPTYPDDVDSQDLPCE